MPTGRLNPRLPGVQQRGGCSRPACSVFRVGRSLLMRGPCLPGPGQTVGRGFWPESASGVVTLTCPPLASLEEQPAGSDWGRALGRRPRRPVPRTLSPPALAPPCCLPPCRPAQAQGPRSTLPGLQLPGRLRGSETCRRATGEGPARCLLWPVTGSRTGGIGPPAQKLRGQGGSPRRLTTICGPCAWPLPLPRMGWVPDCPLHPVPMRPLPESPVEPPKPQLVTSQPETVTSAFSSSDLPTMGRPPKVPVTATGHLAQFHRSEGNAAKSHGLAPATAQPARSHPH